MAVRKSQSTMGKLKTARYSSGGNAGRFLTGKSRTQERIDNKLGRIPGEERGAFKRVRDDALDCFDKYMENRQYDHLVSWDASDHDTYVPIRKRKPRIIYNLGKRVVDTVAAKLFGENVFPRFAVEDDPDTEMALSLVVSGANVRLHALYAIKKCLAAGSAFLRFYSTGTALKIESYHSKHCYPTFDDDGDLEELEIRYVYKDQDDLDSLGRAKEKWFRLVLSRETDILYDNPEYTPGGEEPYFEEVARAEHGLGFVQGQWLRTTENKDSPDGESLLAYITDLIDAINYSLSQADQAVSYAHEPQLALSGMDIDEIDDLVKSSVKAWDLGREGKAEFIEADLGGVEKGMELRDKKKQALCDVARVVMLDPEKIVGSAQSAKAMEVLHGPLVELVDELRAIIGPAINEFVQKLFATILILDKRGENGILAMPPNWQPKSLNFVTVWPEIFPMTMEDLQKKVGIGVQVANASLISRETVTKWLATDFGIENVEEEVAKVGAQPQLNPFGAF